MVVMMPSDHLVGPTQRWLILELGSLGAAIDPDRGPVRKAKAGKVAFAVGQAKQGRLAFAHDDDVGAELLQRRLRCRRAMRADRNQDRCEVSNRKRELLRHAKLRRRTTPEQIGWGCGHGDEIWTERA